MRTNTKNSTINPKTVKKVGYNNSGYKKRLEAVENAIDETEAFKTADDTKLHYTFSI